MKLTKETIGTLKGASSQRYPGYGGYKFVGDLSIDDDLIISLDSSFHVTGNINIAGNLISGNSILVDGYVNVGGDIEGEELNSSNFISVGGHIILNKSLLAKDIVVKKYLKLLNFGSLVMSRDNIDVGDYIQAEAIRAKGNIKVGGNIETIMIGYIGTGGGEDAGGSLVAGGLIESGGYISTGSYIKAGEDVKAKRFISAGGQEQHSFEAEKYGTYGDSDIQAGGDISAGEYIHVDYIESGRDIIAGRGIDANVIYAQRYISAGKGELISCYSISEGKVISGILKEYEIDR